MPGLAREKLSRACSGVNFSILQLMLLEKISLFFKKKSKFSHKTGRVFCDLRVLYNVKIQNKNLEK